MNYIIVTKCFKTNFPLFSGAVFEENFVNVHSMYGVMVYQESRKTFVIFMMIPILVSVNQMHACVITVYSLFYWNDENYLYGFFYIYYSAILDSGLK